MMLKGKGGFKPKIARRNAPTPGTQNSDRASQAPAPTPSESQPPPSASPAPPSTEEAIQASDATPTPAAEPEQVTPKPAPRRRTAVRLSAAASAEVAAAAANETPVETPAVQRLQTPEPPPSADPPPPIEDVPSREETATGPLTPVATAQNAAVSILASPPASSRGSAPSASAPPTQSVDSQQAPSRTSLRWSRASSTQNEAAQTGTPAPSGATSGEARPSTSAGPASEALANESQPSDPTAAPKAAAPRGRKRNTAATTVDEEADTNGAESSTAPKKKARVARRAAALPGEEGYQTAAERRAAGTAKRGQKRRSAQATEGDATETGAEGSDARPRRKSARPQREATPEDAENVQIDKTQVKMADLIKDMRIGKKFSLHDELIERERKKRQKKKTDEEEAAEKADAPAAAAAKDSTAEPEGRTSALAPVGETYQIIDGEIVVDQRSLRVNRHARAAQEAGVLEEREEDDFTHQITSATYLRRNMRPQQWTDEETDKFYWALSMFGTDFETIARMFPGKQRKHIKLKFNREERSAPARIETALVGQKTVGMDMEVYKRHTGSEYETTEAIYAEQKRAEDEFEAQQKAAQQAKEDEARKKAEELFGKKNQEGDEAEGGKKKKGRGRKAKVVEAVW
ncbi:hypothetical protein QBC34DRAFT_388104 [Podospora aff. communis PSN243]|uniref:Myb-like domain-containing protein n=1 Tax=Podospora aff. communis PSN243 TaxID=3040156 RepID=A0AAV9H6Y8_9PEZI|nr:hypothetical protein QBC34DRAFT_388104 [Podospora aff. communis PSN243]